MSSVWWEQDPKEMGADEIEDLTLMYDMDTPWLDPEDWPSNRKKSS